MCYGVFGRKGTVDALRGRNSWFMSLNLSSSTLYLLGVMFSILFLALIFLLCLIIVISVLDVILSMYTPSVLGAFDLWKIVIYKKKKRKYHQILNFISCSNNILDYEFFRCNIISNLNIFYMQPCILCFSDLSQPEELPGWWLQPLFFFCICIHFELPLLVTQFE